MCPYVSSQLNRSQCTHPCSQARHGFNKQTFALFLKDAFITALLACVFVPFLVLAITYILMISGPFAPLYLWAFLCAFSLFMMAIFPSVIQPLFNKFTPLPEGPLRTRIEQLAASLKFPLKKLYTMDGSKRSQHSERIHRCMHVLAISISPEPSHLV